MDLGSHKKILFPTDKNVFRFLDKDEEEPKETRTALISNLNIRFIKNARWQLRKGMVNIKR
jgi:hypothetical protein